MRPDRLLISGGLVVDRMGRASHADVLVADGVIKAVGPSLHAGEGVAQIDATQCLVVPGLINAHTHAHNNLSRAPGDCWTLEQLRARGPALYGGRTPEEQYLSAAVGAIEMLESGCTAAYDQFAAIPVLSEEGIDAVVQAYMDVGMRVVLAPSVADLPFYEVIPGLLELVPADARSALKAMTPAPASRLLELTEYAIRQWHGSAAGRIHVATAPVIPGLCTDDLLQGCMRLVREHGISLHTHLAESRVQALAAEARWGKSIVAHLHDLGILGPHFVGGHTVWVVDDDITRLADAGCTVAHNPASNLKLANGIAPIREMHDRGISVGLGSDGSHSSDSQNLFEAMRIAALVGTLRFPDAPALWIGAREAWRMATAGSAAVLGLQDDIGAIRVGMKADLVVLRDDQPRPPDDAVVHALVYAESGRNVSEVVVDGSVVVRERRVTTVDRSRILAQAREAAVEARARSAAKLDSADALAPYLDRAAEESWRASFPVDRYRPQFRDNKRVVYGR